MEILFVIFGPIIISAIASGILTALGLCTFWMCFCIILGAFYGVVVLYSGDACDL